MTESVTATKANQTIIVTLHTPATAVYNTSFSVAASGGGSGNAVTFSSTGACSNSGDTFTMTSGTGTCTVKYDQAGDGNYNAAPQVTESANALKANQTITVTQHAPASAAFNQQFTVAATGGGSGSAVTFSSSGACSNTGATFTITSATGTCSVRYDQAGDANYNAAPQVVESVSVGKTDQAITVTQHAPASAVFGTSFSVAATGGGSGNAVTFSSSGACSNTGATFTMTSGTGTCSVRYDQAGDANYNPAPQMVETVNGQKADADDQRHHARTGVGGLQHQLLRRRDRRRPGNAVTFSSSGACSNTGATFTMTSGTGTCSVRYDQAGDSNYSAAPQVAESTTAQKADQTINVTTHAPANAAYNSSFAVAANAPGGAVSFSSSGSCTNTGATFTITSGGGTCTVKYDQAGNANYNAAPQVTDSVNAQKANQTILVTLHAPPSAVFNTGFSVAADGGGSGNAVTFSSSGVCTNAGASFTMTSGTGTCTVKYDQGGDANYNAAQQVTESVTAQKASQTITFAPLPDRDLRRPGLHRQRDGELRPRGLLRRHRPVHGHGGDGPPDRSRQLHDHSLAGRRHELRRRDRCLAHLPDQRPRRERRGDDRRRCHLRAVRSRDGAGALDRQLRRQEGRTSTRPRPAWPSTGSRSPCRLGRARWRSTRRSRRATSVRS